MRHNEFLKAVLKLFLSLLFSFFLNFGSFLELFYDPKVGPTPSINLEKKNEGNVEKNNEHNVENIVEDNVD